MNVVILGGSGRAGRRAARMVLAHPAVEEITIVGLDAEKAQHVAGTVAGRARAASVDVRSPDELRAVLAGADVVLNATAPFFLLGAAALQAAIRARCRYYVDLCDDWEPVLEMRGLDGEARAAGVTALIGLGLAPGVTSLLAVRAMQELETCTEIVTGWPLVPDGASADQGGNADPAALRAEPASADRALVHLMHCCCGTIRSFRAGNLVDRPPLEPFAFSYPGLGECSGWTVGSPEAVTLQRARPGVRDNVNLMMCKPGIASGLRALGQAVDAGALSLEDAAAMLAELQTPASSPAPAPERTAQAGPAGIFAVVSGERQGRPAVVAAAARVLPAGGHTGAGVVLGLTPELICRGLLARPGVHMPEDVVEPMQLFDLLAPHCRPAFSDGAALVDVKVEWQ